ncbi:translin-associated factor X-interacting protein 1 isoform X1 [Oreochromis aureus]|uniref:Translin-associated factor X-interacting protein 1 N-terminal domain-containing protein n=1 Tax=Oreochromis aureus TaxID=47969 RepID=A0AAZ1X4N3_OREAU|nr:translin-associated factor X-interacting protein 1 isoform X1 [Oreochromis aureus]
MSPNKDIKFPPLTPSQKTRLTYEHNLQSYTAQESEEGHEEESAGGVSVQPCATRKCWTGGSFFYAGPDRKPQLLMQLENYVSKELHAIDPHEPKFQELKLQVYRNAFECFITAFKTYQPLLSAIKKEYENTFVRQGEQIKKLEPLQSHLRLVTEECDRKIQARWAEEQAEIAALKMEKQKLKEEIEAMRKREKTVQAVVDHLQSELSDQYLQYREERDARRLLIWQLNDMTKSTVKEERSADKSTDWKDPVELQLALKVCREDLRNAQEELNRMNAEYWGVVPQCDWDALEQKHQRTELQLKTLQDNFDQLKSEHDTLLELHKRGSMQAKTHVSTSVQTDESGSQWQSHIQSQQQEEPVTSDAPESNMFPVHESREAHRTTYFGEETDLHVASSQGEAGNSGDPISS